MIESPVLKELMAENTRKTKQEDILQFLEARFGRKARTLRPALAAIEGKRLGAGTREGIDMRFEFPLLRELVAKNGQANILRVLVGRFGREARSLRPTIRPIVDGKRLEGLLIQAVRCPDLESFKKLLEP